MPAYKDKKTGKWFCKFYYTDWQGNNRQKWKRGFATKKEALAYERDFLEKQSANPDMTFQNLYELYMEDMTARLKQSTILTKTHICETHILPFFGKKPINEIKASDVRRWQNQLMNSPKGYSKTYLKTINNQLTCMINYAKRFYDLNMFHFHRVISGTVYPTASDSPFSFASRSAFSRSYLRRI